FTFDDSKLAPVFLLRRVRPHVGKLRRGFEASDQTGNSPLGALTQRPLSRRIAFNELGRAGFALQLPSSSAMISVEREGAVLPVAPDSVDSPNPYSHGDVSKLHIPKSPLS